MTSSDITIRIVAASERRELLRFHIPNHLQGSAYSPDSLKAQIRDLRLDFPCLYDDALFEACTVWVAARHPADSGESGSSANVPGRIVGCVGLTLHLVGDEPSSLDFLSVCSSERKCGLGARLLATALGHADASGAERVGLDTLHTICVAACKLYHRSGFEFERERITPYYRVLYLIRRAPQEDNEPGAVRSRDVLPWWCVADDAIGGEATVRDCLWAWPGRNEAITAAAVEE